MFLGIYGVVEITRIGTIDGDEWHRAQVDTTARLVRIDLLAKILCLAQRTRTELHRERIAGDRRLGGHFERALGIENLDDLGHGRALGVGIARDACNHPVVSTRAG